MYAGTAILIVGFAALVAAFCLLLIGLVYSELMNSEIPPGVTNPRKLHAVHCFLVGTAVLGRIFERLGLCSQVGFVRWCQGCIIGRKRPPPPGLRIKDLTFSGVPVRVYESTTISDKKRRGLVYFHGGGWIFGSLDMYENICRHIAKESDTTVVSVCYRLAPEHRFPAHLDDCEAATRHFLSVAESDFAVDPHRVAIGGDSAGGNLTAALGHRLSKSRDGGLPASPCALVLIYPALQMVDFQLPSYEQNQAVPILFRDRTIFYYLQYLNGDMSVSQDILEGRHVPAELMQSYRKWLDPSNLPPEFRGKSGDASANREVLAHDGEVYHLVKDGLQPEFSPLLAEDEDLRHTPPTFLLTCQYDVLRDDGILYQKRLKELGVDVTWHHVADGFHGIVSFFDQGKLEFPSAHKAMDEIYSVRGPKMFIIHEKDATYNKWRQPGWRVEQKYSNRVLVGNWAEERLQFTRECKTSNSTNQLDFRPQMEHRPDVFVRRTALRRAEGLPSRFILCHHETPQSHYLVSLYDESYGRRDPSALRKWHTDKVSWEPERSDHPLTGPPTNFGLAERLHRLEQQQVALPMQSAYKAAFPLHPTSAFCQPRHSRAPHLVARGNNTDAKHRRGNWAITLPPLITTKTLTTTPPHKPRPDNMQHNPDNVQEKM